MKCVVPASWILALAVLSGCRTSRGRGSATVELRSPSQPLALPKRSPESHRADHPTVRVVFAAPYAISTPAPSYPVAALAARAGAYVVYLTFTIDEAGHPTDVHPSVDKLLLPSRFSQAFVDAATTAVERWTFTPPRRISWQVVPGHDDQYLGAEPATKIFEAKLTFAPP